MRLILSILFISFAMNATAQEPTLTISFDGIKQGKGKLYVALYDTKESFLKKPIKGTVVEVSHGKATAIFNELKAGIFRGCRIMNLK